VKNCAIVLGGRYRKGSRDRSLIHNKAPVPMMAMTSAQARANIW